MSSRRMALWAGSVTGRWASEGAGWTGTTITTAKSAGLPGLCHLAMMLVLGVSESAKVNNFIVAIRDRSVASHRRGFLIGRMATFSPKWSLHSGADGSRRGRYQRHRSGRSIVFFD